MSVFKKLFSSKNTFYCFTPEVSLATFLIEITLALYVFFRYKSTTFSTVCIGLLACLAGFQLSEFLICRFPYGDLWIKTSYLSTIFLPAFGMHMATLLTSRSKYIHYLSYLSAIIFSIALLLSPGITVAAVCLPRYVEITSESFLGWIHVVQYYIFVPTAFYALIMGIIERKRDTNNQKWLIAAYLVFLVPALGLRYLHYINRSGVPSVMCGFALLTAFVITQKVLPRYYLASKKTHKHN